MDGISKIKKTVLEVQKIGAMRQKLQSAVSYVQKKTKIKRQLLQNVENQIEILEPKDVLIESDKRI